MKREFLKASFVSKIACGMTVIERPTRTGPDRARSSLRLDFGRLRVSAKSGHRDHRRVRRDLGPVIVNQPRKGLLRLSCPSRLLGGGDHPLIAVNLSAFVFPGPNF